MSNAKVKVWYKNELPNEEQATHSLVTPFNEEQATYSLVTPFRLFKQNSKPVVDMHCVKYRNVTKFPGGNFVETQFR